MIAIIGGSGLTRLPEMNITHRRIVRTPYGLPSSPLMMGKLGSHEIMFIARHGLNHTLSPHEINYRANIWALHSAKADHIISVATVAGLNEAHELADCARQYHRLHLRPRLHLFRRPLARSGAHRFHPPL